MKSGLEYHELDYPHRRRCAIQESDLALTAHLMRRAGFGATRDELEVLSTRSYEAVVEDLIHPERFPDIDEDIAQRYFGIRVGSKNQWIYRMVNSRRPLEEKIALFWHHVFATANTKASQVTDQIDMFRRNGLSNLRTILTDLSRDPAMIFWLDNNENVKGQPNENYGRELLELFSMGVGNYSEDDIKNAARAFTGWTITQPIPQYPTNQGRSNFVYRDELHDNGSKTFLGHTGSFNGEHIIDIIVGQEATAKFIARHLYNFFVADEPQVPAWQLEPPQDQEAIDALVKTYMDTDGEIRAMMRVLFNSDFFKEARFKRVKSPAELVAGVIRLVGTHRFPDPGVGACSAATMTMGQELMNPPTVEGWHTGREWIDGGAMTERINFAVNEVGDPTKPGVAAIIDRLDEGSPLQPEEFVDRCLDLMGPLIVEDVTRSALLDHADSGGPLSFDSESDRKESADRAVRMLQLIVSTGEFQFA